MGNNKLFGYGSLSVVFVLGIIFALTGDYDHAWAKFVSLGIVAAIAIVSYWYLTAKVYGKE
jgi:hypothetical protein